MNKERQEEYEKAKEFLKEHLKDAKTIYKLCRHVSNSGMSRRLSFFVVKDNELINLDWYIEKCTSYKRDRKNEGLRVSGCGMDMGFAVLYDVFFKVFGTEYEWQGKHRNEWI